MRVISGLARGRRLKELQGMDTRPTTDKVKESMFNILQFELEGRDILDLFSGTGQLGIEALSRGAARCTFVDQRKEAIALIRENIKVCNFIEQSRAVQSEALSFLAGCREKYDIIFLDPPYHGSLLEQSLQAIVRFDILREHGIILCESAADWSLPPLPSPFQTGREYRYGKIKLSLCHRAGSEENK
jgi:16S rRNA (guanine966-N2)-methyltransferase